MTFQTATHTLAHPIEHDGSTYRTISIREPNIGDLEQIEDLGISKGKPVTLGQFRRIITILADAPNEVIGKMHREDFSVLAELSVPLHQGSRDMSARSSS